MIPVIAAFAGAAATATAGAGNPMMDMLAANIGLEFVEGRSQAQSRIVVRLTAIDAITIA
ncbi:MAG: hypothetical protein EXQ57_01465 [Bryobacterales bacterium]|nr:hypothetical protein [Bryobacterales bacterium]